MEKLNRSYIRHTKSILVGFISLLVLGACSSVPEEEVEETEVVDETTEVESEEEVEAAEKEEAERKAEEERIAKEEEEKLALEAKEKEEEERKAKEEEERKAEEERVAKEKEEKERKAEEERVAKEEAERKAKEEEERKAKEEAERKAKEEELDVSLGEDAYLAIMQENLSAFVDVEFNKENKIFILTPNNETLNTEIAMLTQGIGHEDWGILVDGLASMSKSGMDLVGEGYSINLVNPHNKENILLWIMDGVVMYNVIDDL